MELYMDIINVSLFILAVLYILGSVFSNVALHRIEYAAKAILCLVLLLPETIAIYGLV